VHSITPPVVVHFPSVTFTVTSGQILAMVILVVLVLPSASLIVIVYDPDFSERNCIVF
jgi:hypothetical protein